MKPWSCLGQNIYNKISTLSRTTPSILWPYLGQRTKYCILSGRSTDTVHKNSSPTTIVHYHTLFRTDSHNIIYPVKNDTLSSGTPPIAQTLLTELHRELSDENKQMIDISIVKHMSFSYTRDNCNTDSTTQFKSNNYLFQVTTQ